MSSDARLEYVRATKALGVESNFLGEKEFSAMKLKQALDAVHGAAKRVIQEDGKCADFFESLLGDSNSSVCEWAALHLLPFRPRTALKVLKRYARSDSFGELSLKTVVAEWRRGEFDPHWFMTGPFAENYRANWFERLRRNFHYFTTF